MVPLQATILALVALAGLGVVESRDPLRQVVMTSLFGLLLVVLFMVFQAPDVALSMLVVGGVGYPVVILVAITRIRAAPQEDDAAEGEGEE